MIQHIFFDLDNTLWDHRKNAELTLLDLFKKEKIQELHGMSFKQFHKVYDEINEQLWKKIRDGIIDKDYLRKHRFYDTFIFFGIDNFALSQRFEENFLDQIIRYNELVDGAFEILEYLSRKNYGLHIISNGFQEVTHRKCELSGIYHFFDTISSADEINIRKPNREIFRYAFSKSHATPENSIMIGDDWIADIIGGRNFGLKTIFLDIFDDGSVLSDVVVIKNLKELKEIL